MGVKQIYVCPDVNYGAAVHADKWIPVNPNTDVALHLAIAYTWIENGWFDQEYVCLLYTSCGPLRRGSACAACARRPR